MGIKLEQIAPYLPYGLNGVNAFGNKVGVKSHHYFNEEGVYIGLHPKFKPILRPLSDLTKEIEVDGEKIVVSDKTIAGFDHGRFHCNIGIIQNRLTTNSITYDDMQVLLRYHFDVFGLIESGDAVDMNTIETLKH